MPYQAPIRWEIAEEHLDEAAFLRQLWEQSLRSPEYSLAEIAAGPGRTNAALSTLSSSGVRGSRRSSFCRL